MSIKTLILIAMLFVKFSFSQSISNQVIGTTGSFSIASGISLSATSGETAIETFSSGNNILTQGFQQPNENGVGIIELKENNFSVKIFPNPTADFLIVQYHSDNGEEYSVSLYDLLGRKLNLINNQFENGNEFSISFQLTQLPSACYFLTIENASGEIKKTFPIIKTSL